MTQSCIFICHLSVAGKLEGVVSVSREVRRDLLISNAGKPPGSKRRKQCKSSRLICFFYQLCYIVLCKFVHHDCS